MQSPVARGGYLKGACTYVTPLSVPSATTAPMIAACVAIARPHVHDDPVAQAYVDLLAREPWHWFATLTFSPEKKVRDKWTGELRKVDRFHPIHGMHLEAADKAFRWFNFELNKSLYGNNWRRVPHGGVVWARGQEFHRSGKVHFHCLYAAPDVDLNSVASRYYWHEVWFREFGRNQIERPRDQDDVLGYVSKYVTKDGEVDMSPNFG
ncbi:MAG: hypothetical protein M3451_08765, partial [Chloroflexota bacterium]|nr:hypothetical protein [Chloroflexota bacterium]